MQRGNRTLEEHRIDDAGGGDDDVIDIDVPLFRHGVGDRLANAEAVQGAAIVGCGEDAVAREAEDALANGGAAVDGHVDPVHGAIGVGVHKRPLDRAERAVGVVVERNATDWGIRVGAGALAVDADELNQAGGAAVGAQREVLADLADRERELQLAQSALIVNFGAHARSAIQGDIHADLAADTQVDNGILEMGVTTVAPEFLDVMIRAQACVLAVSTQAKRSSLLLVAVL